jgi:hypothetical protein
VRNVEDIQRLMGCLAALNRFMSRLGELGLPLYKMLKKSNSFCWTDEMYKALDELKMLISKTLVLAAPEPSETLLLYIVVTVEVITVALAVEREEPEHVYKVLRMIYYIIRYKSYFIPS